MSLSLSLSAHGEAASEDQRQAREIVEVCSGRSFGFKLAHVMILRVFRETLGSLCRKYEEPDDVVRTHTHWLRFGIIHWNQDVISPPVIFPPMKPIKKGLLLRDY